MEKKVFGYPEFSADGERVLCTYDNEYSDMLMDVRVYRMEPGSSRSFCFKGEETAILLLSGDITYEWEGNSKEVTRKDVFTEGPWALHVCTGVEAKVTANAKSEILVQRTKNDAEFASKLYKPEDAPWGYSCVGKFGNVAKRRVNTIFDHDIAPYSNMVLGEVVNLPGKWSSYPPHHHPQPECYFYRYDKPMGFGAGWGNGEIYETHHNGLAIITDKMHSQVTGPGYSCCYAWGIRHLPGDPWDKTRIDDEEHLWLLADDANDHIWHCPTGN